MNLTIRKKAAVCVLLLFVCFVALTALWTERYEERTLKATFIGLTNKEVVIRFPSVHDRAPSANFLFKPSYNMGAAVGVRQDDGTSLVFNWGQNLALNPNQPFGEMEVRIPFYRSYVSVVLIKAEGVLRRDSDKEFFGWKIPSLKARRWRFEMDEARFDRTLLTNALFTELQSNRP